MMLRHATTQLASLLLLLAAPLATAQVPTLASTVEPPEPAIERLNFGNTLTTLGDVNGDGVDDFASGGALARDAGLIDVGRAYVISGATGAVIHTLTPPVATQQGRFGDYIANLGDVNADGTDDVVLTETGANLDATRSGAAYVYSGATGAILYTVHSPAPIENGRFGSAASAAGDLTGDGIEDFMIGALGEQPNGASGGLVHLFSGATGAFLRTIAPPFAIGSGNITEFFAREVYLIGDRTGDGMGEHAVFTRYGGGGGGRVDFFDGATGAHLDGLISPYTTVGADFGAEIVSIPDLTGDGIDEIVIGAPGAEPTSNFPPREGRGVVGIYSGSDLTELRVFRPALDPTNTAQPGGMGAAIVLGDDVDNDGVRDLYLGAPGANLPGGPQGSNAGKVYIINPETGTFLGELPTPTPALNGVFGDALALANLDADPALELIVGAPGEADQDGRVYLFDQTAATPIVMDGSFESGLPNDAWTSSGTPSDPICSVSGCGPNEGIEAYDGEWFAFFGRAADATMGSVQQDVTIPEDVNTLSFYVKVPVSNTGGDLSARLDGEILWAITQADGEAYREYRRVDVDLSAYADGGTHTLRFQSATASSSPPARTFFFVDQVSINNRISTANVALSPSQVDFGSPPVGTSNSLPLTVANTGGDPLVVSAITLTPFQNLPVDALSVDTPTPFTVAPGESTDVTITFAPTEAGTQIATVSVLSNAASSPNTVLAGGTAVATSLFSLNAETLDFEVDEGETSTAQTLTLANNGIADGTYTVTTTVTPPSARAPQTLRPADRLRLPADFAASPAPSAYRAGGSGELVADGSFEATPDDDTRDNPFWDESSAQIGSPFCNVGCFNLDVARTGDWAAILGFDQTLGTDFFQQDLTLDAGDYDLTLFYAGGTDRDEDDVEEAEGAFRVFFDGDLVYELTADEAQDFTLDYQQLTIPVTVDAAGDKTLRVEFEQITADPDEDVMQILVDDISIAPATLRLTVDPRIGTIEAGGEQTLTVTADATDAEVGTYAAQIRIDTDDPSMPTLTVDVTVVVQMIVAGEDGSVPTAFALRPSFPNPTAGRATIGYDLAESTDVRLDVYDVTGRLVTTLVDETLPAGRYSADWDAADLPSGAYLYRIQAGTYRDAHRMVVIR